MCRAGWWWPLIQLAKRRAPLASRVREWSTNSSSPICRSRGLLLPMSSKGICIVAPLNLLWQMRIGNKTPIAGAVSPPAGRSAGSWSRNGCGTCAWSWDTTCILTPCARPSLLLPSPLLHRTRLLPRAMLPLTWAWPGKRAASQAKTLLSNPMGRCGAPLARS